MAHALPALAWLFACLFSVSARYQSWLPTTTAANTGAADDLSLMQVLLHHMHHEQPAHKHLHASDDCTAPAPASDYDRPIPDVLAEHPGVGGACYFGACATWFAECARELERRDVSNFGLWARSSGYAGVSYLQNILHDPNNPDLQTITYWGGTIKTNNFDYPWDDIYCHGNGWLKFPAEQMSNYSFWNSAARKLCAELLEEFPAEDRTMNEMFARSYREGDTPGFAGNQAILNGTYTPTQTDMRRHASWKCALDPNGVACDMSYCVANFCELDGGYIGHTTECDRNSGR